MQTLYDFCVKKYIKFITVQQRNQTYFATLEDRVAGDNPVRLMDAFIDKLGLQKLGFQKTVHKSEGRPPYAPGVLLKLYLYGYLNKIRSSSKLERECSRNIELQWLLQNPRPDSCLHEPHLHKLKPVRKKKPAEAGSFYKYFFTDQ